jgi:hypothetical protein
MERNGMTAGPQQRVGRVTPYAAARLVPRAGANLTAEAITLDYQRWCATVGAVPLRDGAFRQQLARLAAQIDLKSEANDADTLYRDVALVGETF